MVERSRGLLFRKRNILGVALIAGIGVGMYLGKPGWFGFGESGTGSKNGEMSVSTEPGGKQTTSPESENEPEEKDVGVPMQRPEVVDIVIDDRTILLRKTSGDTPIELAKLMKLVKQAKGNPDGFKLRVYEKPSARVSVEEDLKNALVAHSIPDSAVFWVPLPVK